MALRTAALVVGLFVWCFSLGHSEAHQHRRLTKEEHQELERQFQHHKNRPAVKTILTKDGEKYRCVDFYKQPAFDHPSLQNHTFHPQMRPSSYPMEKRNETRELESKAKSIWKNGKGCPHGTVPIKDVTKDEFIENKLAAKAYASLINPQTDQASRINLQTDEALHVHYAILHTKGAGPYYGGGVVSTVYNPQVHRKQFSGARLKLQNGPDSIEVGWLVYPHLFKDNKTHFYIYTNAGTSHCFNTDCPGFIIVRPDLPVGHVLSPTSTPGRSGNRYAFQFFIYKDAANGNWFLEIGDGLIVGFWPKTRFTRLANSADYVDWGGLVYNPTNQLNPPMGSGNTRLFEDISQDAFCCNITVINQDHKVVDALDTAKFTDIDTYKVVDWGFTDKQYRHMFYFGGLDVGRGTGDDTGEGGGQTVN